MSLNNELNNEKNSVKSEKAAQIDRKLAGSMVGSITEAKSDNKNEKKVHSKSGGVISKKNLLLTVILLFCLIASVASLTACNAKAKVSLADVPVKQYVHNTNGAALTIPKDWQESSSDKKAVVFTNPDSSLALTVRCEIGGFSYYSYEELEMAAAKIAESTLVDAEILKKEVYESLDNSIRVIAQGHLGDSKSNAVTEVVIVSPLKGVRYYLVSTCGVNKYAENSKLLSDIYNSFYVSITEDELYKQIPKKS